MAKFRIAINDFRGGLAPGYFENDFPIYGNKNMAGKASGIDLTDPSYLKQGVGNTTIATGTDEIRILDEPVEENKTYGVGASAVYEITPTSVSAIHTITGATFEDIAYYQGNVYASYNTSASGAIAKFDGTTWTNAWQTTLNKDKPHKMLVGGLDFLYVADGNKVASYDGINDLFTPDDLTLPQDHTILTLGFTQKSLEILTNTPSVSTGARSSIFRWDTSASSYEVETTFRERITNLFIHSGAMFVFYEDAGKARLGYLDGSDIKPLVSFGTTSPLWYQVTVYKGFISWINGEDILCWGAPESFLPPLMFPIMKAEDNYEYKTAATPFGYIIASSVYGSNYRVDKASGYSPSGYWKSLLIPINGVEKEGYIDDLRIGFASLPAGKSFTVKLVNSKNVTKFEQEITGTGEVRYWKGLSLKSDDIRLEIHFDDTSGTVYIKDAVINGHTTN